MAEKIIVIDEGTTSTRTMLFDADGTPLGSAQREFRQHYPGPGLVEHDAAEIWTATLDCTRDIVEQAGGAHQVAAIGITNQRETVVFWDRKTGEPLAPAIVWQDRRTAADCAALKEAGHEAAVQAKSGLLLDPYFSGTKMRWMLDNVPDVRSAPSTVITKNGGATNACATTPAAVVRRGTTKAQRVVTADLATLPGAVKAAGITPPALTIVGDVVSLQPRLAWFHPERDE